MNALRLSNRETKQMVDSGLICFNIDKRRFEFTEEGEELIKAGLE